MDNRGTYNRGRGGAGRGRGRDGGGNRGGGGRGGNYQHQQQQQGQYQSGGDYSGRGWGRGGSVAPMGGDPVQGYRPVQGQGGGYRPVQEPVGGYRPVQGQGGGYRPVQGQGRGFRPVQGQGVGPKRPEFGESSGDQGAGRGGGGVGVGGGRGAWGTPSNPRAWGPPSSGSPVQSQRPPVPLPDIPSLKISEQQPSSSSLRESTENRTPIRRPDRGGTLAIRPVKLLVNHFPVGFNPNATIMHYDVDIKVDAPSTTRPVKKTISKADIRSIKDKLFSDDPDRFPRQMTAYDGEKNIFSAVPLPTGEFRVELSDGEGTRSRCYIFTTKLVNELKFSKLKDYLSGNLLHIPRDILQGMDLVMKENPSSRMISVGRSFYNKEFRRGDDLGYGVAAFRGFQQSLKPTSQGLSLCLDYSVLAFRKRLPVIDFLKEHVYGFKEVTDVKKLQIDVKEVLVGLKVTVTHRLTKQKYTIAGLTKDDTQDLSFIQEDREGNVPPKEVGLVSYFREKYDKEILHKDIPCLDLGKNNRNNYVPMEFCVLVEGQRYPKEYLNKNEAILLKNISLPRPKERMNTILDMVRSNDGPCGEVTRNFEIGVVKNMTKVGGRVIEPPDLKLGGSMSSIRVDKDKCQWNLVGKSVVDGKPVERWAFIDFSSSDRFRLQYPDAFIDKLRERCYNLGVLMERPVVYRTTRMNEFSSVSRLQKLLVSVTEEAKKKCGDRLQIIICVMAAKHDGYKYLKWVSETQIGVLTQCCLSSHANKGQDQYLANLAMKINAKLGGSNVELVHRLPHFEGDDHVMFVGADVNHPSGRDKTCPSIAAVVATVNWPAANRYAARVCPQEHRKETIVNFGSMCLDLVNTYARINKVKPKKIVVFRDGVSEGQFNMVLNEELVDLKAAIYDKHYQPTITLVVAQKRHQTRLFLENERDGGSSGNVPPGTVVDTIIIHPFEFDFYLCSHYGGLGTSKPTHYYVLYDEHNFTSNQLQKLIYNLCFTFARCTKPVSLVPPVYYADLVAYRGRLFQEVATAMEMQSPASLSSSTSALSSLSAGASFSERFYKLHAELENFMFFV